MNASGEKSVSLWMATAAVEQPGPLIEDARADVVVVGAGIAGLSTATSSAGSAAPSSCSTVARSAAA